MEGWQKKRGRGAQIVDAVLAAAAAAAVVVVERQVRKIWHPEP